MLLLLMMAVVASARTCYTSNTTTTHYDIIKHATVETQRGCEVLCDAIPKTCVGFSFKEAGFSSSCVLLKPSSLNQICGAPTTVFLKTEACGNRTDLVAEFGQDPCIDEMFPIVQKLNTPAICPQDKTRVTIIRAISADGRRISLDNDKYNYLVEYGDMWAYRYDRQGKNTSVPIVAAVCALAGSQKCPCQPLVHLQNVGKSPTYAAKPDVLNPCQATATFYNDLVKSKLPNGMISNIQDMQAIVTCKAGMWIVWCEGCNDGNSFGVNGIACFK